MLKNLYVSKNHKRALGTLMEKVSGVKVYFANSNSPRQRGMELIRTQIVRQYFSKETDFNKVSLEELYFAQSQVSKPSRKGFNWETPKNEFRKLIGVLKVESSRGFSFNQI